ncbi:hypothetical protein JTB14_034193 [Gonioctena quinquepunctata]|nr:hypothetical protein JTB14_034193 [Gonioctena quinquepunctata]
MRFLRLVYALKDSKPDPRQLAKTMNVSQHAILIENKYFQDKVSKTKKMIMKQIIDMQSREDDGDELDGGKEEL